MNLVLLFVACFVVSLTLTELVRRYAVRRSVLDVPNERSSHSAPTPRGGGLAIAAVTLAAVAAGGAAGWIARDLALALAGGGTAIAGIGWLDDHRDVPARWRALVHFVAGGWAVFWLGGLPLLETGIGRLTLGPFGSIVAVVGLVWLTNLYNFMDGIDGIAASEAVVVGLGGGLLCLAAGRPDIAAAALIVSAASGGFLLWNWSPARIFMGDVGSGLLGFLFGVIAIASERAGAVPLLAWVLLLGVFVVDATLTLFRRLARGERWYAAHRSHAYQRAVGAGWSHARVTSAAAALSVVLAALAWAGVTHGARLLPCFGAGMAMLLVAYFGVDRVNPFPMTAPERSAPTRPG